MNKIPVYLWDNSVLVALFKNEPPANEPGFLAVVGELDRKEASLVLPSIIYTEFVESHFTDDQIKKFREFLNRSNVEAANVTVQMAQTAHDIRNSGLKEKPKRVIKTADSIYLACGMMYAVDMLHTVDDGMLKLDGNPIVHGLRISKPATINKSQSLC